MSPKLRLGDILCLFRFFFLFLSFFRQKFVWHISRQLLNGNQWNFTGMLSTMSRCSNYFRNFQNGRRCHGNGQNAKQLKNTKMNIAGYSPNRNWWNVIGTTSTSQKKSESVGQTSLYLSFWNINYQYQFIDLRKRAVFTLKKIETGTGNLYFRTTDRAKRGVSIKLSFLDKVGDNWKWSTRSRKPRRLRKRHPTCI